MQRYECFLEQQKYFGVGKSGPDWSHRVDAEPHRHQLVVHVAGAEVCKWEGGAILYSAPRHLASLAGEMSTGHFFLLVSFLAIFNLIQRYSPPLTGVIAGGNEGVKPLGFKAVHPFGFMYWYNQLFFFGCWSRLPYELIGKPLISTYLFPQKSPGNLSQSGMFEHFRFISFVFFIFELYSLFCFRTTGVSSLLDIRIHLDLSICCTETISCMTEKWAESVILILGHASHNSKYILSVSQILSTKNHPSRPG